MSKRGSKLKENRESSSPYQQMKLPLDELLDAHPGELIPLEIDVDDIGGELLAILSKGLYTDPLHCIREYVQNAVDANAHSATIKLQGTLSTFLILVMACHSKSLFSPVNLAFHLNLLLNMSVSVVLVSILVSTFVIDYA